MNKICQLCSEPIEIDQESTMNSSHRECAIRMALGGIGHLVDHDYWCLEKGDPDMGLSYRQSSLDVFAWIVEHGMEAAIARSITERMFDDLGREGDELAE